QAGGGGPGDLLAVDGGGQVDGGEVAVLGRALDTGEGAEAGAQVVELGLHLLVGHLDVGDGDRQVVQVRDRDLRTDVDLGGELQHVLVLELGDLEVGLAEGADVAGLHGLHVLGGDGLVDDLVEHRSTADPALKDGRGGLARAEAGDPDLLSDLAVGAVEVRFELVERHLDIDLHARRAQLLDGALQRFLLGGQVYRTVYSCRVRAVHAGARGAYAWFVGSPVSTAGGRGGTGV